MQYRGSLSPYSLEDLRLTVWRICNQSGKLFPYVLEGDLLQLFERSLHLGGISTYKRESLHLEGIATYRRGSLCPGEDLYISTSERRSLHTGWSLHLGGISTPRRRISTSRSGYLDGSFSKTILNVILDHYRWFDGEIYRSTDFLKSGLEIQRWRYRLSDLEDVQ